MFRKPLSQGIDFAQPSSSIPAPTPSPYLALSQGISKDYLILVKLQEFNHKGNNQKKKEKKTVRVLGAEIAVSRDHAIALQPGQQERNFVSKKSLLPFRQPKLPQVLVELHSSSSDSSHYSGCSLSMSSGRNLKGAQHFGRPRQAVCLSSGVQDQPGQHSQTPSLPKIQKTEFGGMHIRNTCVLTLGVCGKGPWILDHVLPYSYPGKLQ
ncbi:hypothetical protein AAY473_008835, partial [Plecturocebus cupreus]